MDDKERNQKFGFIVSMPHITDFRTLAILKILPTIKEIRYDDIMIPSGCVYLAGTCSVTQKPMDFKDSVDIKNLVMSVSGWECSNKDPHACETCLFKLRDEKLQDVFPMSDPYECPKRKDKNNTSGEACNLCQPFIDFISIEYKISRLVDTCHRWPDRIWPYVIRNSIKHCRVCDRQESLGCMSSCRSKIFWHLIPEQKTQIVTNTSNKP